VRPTDRLRVWLARSPRARVRGRAPLDVPDEPFGPERGAAWMAAAGRGIPTPGRSERFLLEVEFAQ